MLWHHARNVLVVFGAYYCATWLGFLLEAGGAALGIEVSGYGRLGEVWLALYSSSSAIIAAGVSAALLWFTLGAGEARRWSWALAGLVVAMGFFSRSSDWLIEPDIVSWWIDRGVHHAAPALAIALTVWLLGRVAPDRPEPHTTGVAPAVTTPRSRAALAAWTTFVLVVGSVLGMQIAMSSGVKEMTGWMLSGMESARRSDTAFAQYRDASYASAKLALDRYAEYLEGLAPASPPWAPGEAAMLDEDGLALEKLLTYGRVALRAEAADQIGVARDYWQKAEAQAVVLDWEAPLRERIRDAITRLDANHRTAVGSPPAAPRDPR